MLAGTGRGGGARVSEFFLTKNPNFFFFFFFGGGGNCEVGWRIGRWTDRGTGPNPLAPLSSSKFGA